MAEICLDKVFPNYAKKRVTIQKQNDTINEPGYLNREIANRDIKIRSLKCRKWRK